MTKKEMLALLTQLTRKSESTIEIFSRFAEAVMEEHLGVDSNTVIPGTDVLTPGYPFKRNKVTYGYGPERGA